ncbi:MAG: RNA-binding protein [Micrococcaceae bacterium]
MLSEALEHLVRGIVENPDDVKITSRYSRRGEILSIRVNPSDLGRVIGKQGRIATALRSVINAISPGKSVRVDVLETDGGRR